MAFTSTKTYGTERGLSCALRQWLTDSHCHLLHGYSLGFRFTFAAEQLDRRGWVIDFGRAGFGAIREWLHATFDHTLLVAEDDPLIDEFRRLDRLGLADLRVLPGTSCERIAAYAFDHCAPKVEEVSQGRCWIAAVECFEHGANSAIFENPKSLFRRVSSEVLTEALAAGD